MPYEISWEKKGVIVKFKGIFDAKENMNANIELYSNSQFENLEYIIWDLSKVSQVNITEDDANIAAMHDKLASLRLPKVKMALFFVDQRLKRLCEQYIAHAQNLIKRWTFIASDDIESIRKWVNS